MGLFTVFRTFYIINEDQVLINVRDTSVLRGHYFKNCKVLFANKLDDKVLPDSRRCCKLEDIYSKVSVVTSPEGLFFVIVNSVD